MPDEKWGEVVVAAIVLKPGQVVSEQELRSHLAGRLARYKLPSRWLWLAALPRPRWARSSGKRWRSWPAKVCAPGLSYTLEENVLHPAGN
jgi:fatty-acyl-CoA synthase